MYKNYIQTTKDENQKQKIKNGPPTSSPFLILILILNS